MQTFEVKPITQIRAVQYPLGYKSPSIQANFSEI